MFDAVLAHIIALILDLLAFVRTSDQFKNLEIFALRQQLHILQRAQPRPIRLARRHKLILAVCASKLKSRTDGTRTPWSHSIISRSCGRRSGRRMRMPWPNAGFGQRAEVLDRLLILGERHLSRVQREYIDYYNIADPSRVGAVLSRPRSS